MKPLFLGVILAASYAHAASTDVSAKPVTGTAASAEVKTAAVTASQEASGKTLAAAQQKATDTRVKAHQQQVVKVNSDKTVTHKKAATVEKEKTTLEKTGKEKLTEHKITAEKKKNNVDKQDKQKTTAPVTATKTE
ncbi:hypothetical protein [Dickeya dianthicola]|nr:hypothetical protein [Dickeya dianthicola]MCI4070381.1 hypothetical protein [Dickeya dianthicola]MCI4115879.1 hypothetical protein [Dickeya dianthicola]MCI4118092.1 hypothetical protein [Dickeya dianthicola]MCI4124057.1 hypothetical protein [Dickeya dianthicola]MCI4154883.1 hypothetical protein [Dickeya dianthicola]